MFVRLVKPRKRAEFCYGKELELRLYTTYPQVHEGAKGIREAGYLVAAHVQDF